MTAADRISADAAAVMRAAIEESNGDEVVFVCRTDERLVVVDAVPVARGVSDVVAAPRDHLRRGQVVVHNHPSGRLEPSRADVAVAAELADYGVGSYIVDNAVTGLAVIVEPVEPKTLSLLDADALADHIDAGGALTGLIPEFEPREPQIAMLRAVVEAFNEDEVVALEAGTGVGKSLAYLLPAVAWVASNDERVVVSTATINLQQQLVEKDLPTVQRLLGTDVPVMLVKGRGNYLCRRRLGEAFDEDALLFDEPAAGDSSDAGDTTDGRDAPFSVAGADPELVAVREWSESTEDGSRSDLPFTVPDETWSRVNSDADNCTEFACRLRERCFFMQARRKAAAARILVANHHLLFIDLALRVRGIGFEARAVLPPFQRLIFDEAHSIESSATSLFSESFTGFTIRKHARRLRTVRGRRVGGLLATVRRRGADPKAVVRAIEGLSAVEEGMDALNASTVAAVAEPTARITRASAPELLSAVLDPLRELQTRLVALVHALSDVLEDDDGEEGGPYSDLRVTFRRLESLSTLCRSFVGHDEHADRVFWIEVRRSAGGARLARFVSSPLDIRQVMQEAVFEAFDTAVFTSATLTVAGSFDYWAGRVGLLDTPRPHRLESYPSPFPYAEHALVAIPTDAPPPTSPAYAGFLVDFLSGLLAVSEGRGLVLFTSYEMLRATATPVRERLAPQGIEVLRQGDDDRARLLRRFTEETTSVLFATESFWQGIDAAGETLQVVVLCRLPFRVPSDPVLMARMEAIETAGGNAFSDLSLPEAVMKFRQGFGRLIRRATDRGVVVVTDTRILSKGYGSIFLGSIPVTRRSVRDGAGVIEEVERFLYG